MKKISVIIPVYNKQESLSKTIDSIINQSYQNIEIILVNDGSTDFSQQVIEQYENNYGKKVRGFLKENGGLSDARNYGIKQASGDYLCFIDAGDYLDYELFSNLDFYIKQNVDMIKYKMTKVSETGEVIQKVDGPTFKTCTGEKAFKKLYGQDFFLEVACLYLYRKQYWQDNNFEYAKDKYHEDFGLTPIVMVEANTVVSTSEYGYNYVQDQNSITRNNDDAKKEKQAQDLLFHYDWIYEQIEKLNIKEETKSLLLSYYTNCIILKVQELNNKSKRQYIYEIKKRKLYRNIKIGNLKQLIKKILLVIDIRLYLKLK